MLKKFGLFPDLTVLPIVPADNLLGVMFLILLL